MFYQYRYKIHKKISYLVFLAMVVSCKQPLQTVQKEITIHKKQENPNVIFIIADDLGYADLGVYGSSFYETPNIDALVKDGVMFTNGYANCPVCSPSRASFQTGKYPVRTGVTDWIKGRKAYAGTTPNDRWIVPDTDYEMKLQEVTIAEVLKTQGYNTTFIGKWHLGEEEKYWPENQGYDTNIAGWKAGRPYKGYFSPYGNPKLTDGPKGEYLTDRLTSEAIQVIQQNRNAPLFLCLSYYAVHTPLQAKKEDKKKYKQKRKARGLDTIQEFLVNEPWMQTATGDPKSYKERIVQGEATYAAMVQRLDKNIGQLVTYLKQKELYDDTLIVFTSDNGGLSTINGSSTSNLPLAKGKGWMYEGGIRVPFSVKPPHNRKSKVSTIPVSGVDIFPTIVSYVGNKDETMKMDIDGMDLKPWISGEKKTSPLRPIFWHYPHYGNQGGNPASAIRLGNFKLIHDLELGSYELYDLENDVSEKNNVLEQFPKKAEELIMMLENWVQSNYNKPMQKNPNWNEKDPVLN